jgi:serine/threonine-protein kinase RsbW
MPSFERRELHLTLPVARDMEIAATAQVAVLGELLRMERDRIDEVKLAVVEACINAFEHSGTPDRKVEIEFVADEKAGRPFLEVGVADAGRGFDPAMVAEPVIREKIHSKEKRGWGLKIIESLMDDVRIESSVNGTRIVMRKYL